MTARSESGDGGLRPLRSVAARGREAGSRLRRLFPLPGDDSSTTDPEAVPANAPGDDSPDGGHAVGVRTVRESGGSVVVTIPPEAIAEGELDVGDDVVVLTDGTRISLTERDRYLDDSLDV